MTKDPRTTAGRRRMLDGGSLGGIRIVELVNVASWAHLLATVALGGYYATITLVVLPAIRSDPARVGGLAFLATLERRAMPVLAVSLVVFLATGVYLMTNDERYAGIGEVDSPWATLLLIKHVVIVGMLVLGSWLDALLVRPRPDTTPATDDPALDGTAPQAASVAIPPRIVILFATMTALFVVVLALTAAAQAP
jgi:hypothetical protein